MRKKRRRFSFAKAANSLYIKAQKNDDRNAEGISEAATRQTMRFVELKTQVRETVWLRNEQR
jgi:hypothetical protein